MYSQMMFVHGGFISTLFVCGFNCNSFVCELNCVCHIWSCVHYLHKPPGEQYLKHNASLQKIFALTLVLVLCFAYNKTKLANYQHIFSHFLFYEMMYSLFNTKRKWQILINFRCIFFSFFLLLLY